MPAPALLESNMQAHTHSTDLHQPLQLAVLVTQAFTQQLYLTVSQGFLGQAQVRQPLVDDQGRGQFLATCCCKVTVFQPSKVSHEHSEGEDISEVPFSWLSPKPQVPSYQTSHDPPSSLTMCLRLSNEGTGVREGWDA